MMTIRRTMGIGVTLLALLAVAAAGPAGAAGAVETREAGTGAEAGAASTNEPLSARLSRECASGRPMSCVYSEARAVLRTLFAEDKMQLFPGVTVRRRGKEADGATAVQDPRASEVSDVEEFLVDELARYASSRSLQLDVSRLAASAAPAASAAASKARFMISAFIRWPSIWDFIKVPNFLKPFTGKSSFLTGFGLGFLAFGLKKLLLPIIIGGQIIKSVLIAMFLPSILGGLGKLVGKGVSTFASASGSSGGLSGALSGGAGGGGGVDDFGDFKDTGGNYGDTDAAGSDAFANTFMYADSPQYGVNGVSQPGNANANANVDSNSISRMPGLGTGTTALYVPNRFEAQSKVSHHQPLEHFYTRNKQQDFKVFHQIPASSLLLTHYDPFYSPLLSRLDSVFTQLGYSSEACRERLVCAMYSNPARFAPYSNLVSAQLSRELNELRKPSSDNPEILRFFRYMKAAKDGQDGLDCFALHPGCVMAGGAAKTAGAGDLGAPPMLQTYKEINKLVQARRLGRILRLEPVRGRLMPVPAFVPLPVAVRTARWEGQRMAVPAPVPASIPTSLPNSVPTSVPYPHSTSVPTSVPSSIPTSIPTAIPTSLPASQEAASDKREVTPTEGQQSKKEEPAEEKRSDTAPVGSRDETRWIPRTNHGRTEGWRPTQRDDATRSSGVSEAAAEGLEHRRIA